MILVAGAWGLGLVVKVDVRPILVSLLVVFGRGWLLGKLFLVEVHSLVNLDMMGRIMEVCRSRDRLSRRVPLAWLGSRVLVVGERVRRFLMASHRHHSWLPLSSCRLALSPLGLVFVTQLCPGRCG